MTMFFFRMPGTSACTTMLAAKNRNTNNRLEKTTRDNASFFLRPRAAGMFENWSAGQTA